MEVYASGSGTRTAQMVSPAIASPRSQPSWYPRSEVKTGNAPARVGVSRSCSRGGDVEVEVELLQQPGEGGQGGLVAVEPDLPGPGELGGGGLEHHPGQGGLGPGTVRWASGEAPGRAFSTPRLTCMVQVWPSSVKAKPIRRSAPAALSPITWTAAKSNTMSAGIPVIVSGLTEVNGAGCTPARSSCAAVRKIPRPCGPSAW
jgi:hypothetical protein